jgi:transglutaminase-like putative cysteine protease
MQRIHRDFRFVPGVTTVTTPLTEVLEKRHGVCQDFAQLMIGCLRAHGLAARYVSGYIETLPPPGEEKLAGADASHAWCSVFVPDLGWIDFDPTNNIIANDQHITLGWGREFSDVTPLNGVFFSNGEHELKVSVDVVRKGPTTSD